MLEAQILGTTPVDDATCGLPVSAQVARLKHQLADSGLGAISVEEMDLYSLTGPDRDAALDAIVGGEPSPLVLVRGRLVCSGSILLSVVLAALGAHPSPTQEESTWM
ncbi:MAG: hypothetical protein P4L93_07510 [Coriobacteriia bacterium]|nr:hypothetical protein [Coriobacteriia bacterium]